MGMRAQLCAGIMAMCVSSVALAQSSGCDILIINRGFEDPVLADNDFSYFIPGWIVVGDSGSFNPSAQTYPGGSVAEGNNCGYVSCCAGGRAPGSMQQTLPAYLAANTTYDLSMFVGQRLETAWANMRIQLLAGSVPVIDSVIDVPPARGTFERRAFQFVCPTGHPAIGGRLQIRMVHEGGVEHQANYDQFTLIATPNCVSICTQPVPVRTCPGVTVRLTAEHAGIGPFTYQWYRGNSALSDRTNGWGSVIRGATTPTLSISNIKIIDMAEYRLTVTNSCGSVSTQPTLVQVCLPDFNCDGIVDFFDYLDFVDAFSHAALAADFNEDGVIDFFDYLDFLSAYTEGC